ncbi:MAG TPA: phosphotransferase family protein [Candidatus Acidoferrales bacterium]|nr:phosphotransferase family protein [Candidatus Acidoferrales bacterium]
MDVRQMEERLAGFIARQVGADHVSVSGLHRLAGGASRETWSVDVRYAQNGTPVELPLVLRRDPPGSAVETRRRDEFELLRAAAAEGVPVPKVYWLADEAETLGAPFLLMERIDGETIARRLLRDDVYAAARRVMTGQLARILAAIHRIDRIKHRLDFLVEAPSGESPAQGELDRYEQIFRFISPDPHPAFELALRWLRQRLPPGNQRVVVHGDYRIGNVIFGPEGVRSILDWELAHVGDPMEDLGWICVRSWRFGNDDKPVGGIGRREELFRAYEAAGGGAVDPKRVRFWEVLGNLKWGIMTIMQAKTYLDGHVKSVELASLGRRTAEMELELLILMEA